MGKKGVEINEKYFLEHERQMNRFVCILMACLFLMVPIMWIHYLSGIILFSKQAIYGFLVVGSFCTLSPYLLSKIVSSQMAIKYYSFICGLIFVSFFIMTYKMGISIAFFLPAVASCIYFNPTFTMTMTVLSYVAYLLSYYLRYVILAEERYKSMFSASNMVPVVIGFTVEFFLYSFLLYELALRSRTLFVEQKILIGKLQKQEEKLRIALGASADIIFEYDVENDVYTSNRSIRGWKEKEIVIPEFTKYAHAMDWETQDFIELYEHIIHLPPDKGEYFQESLCINFEENGIKYPAWAYFEISIIRNKKGAPIAVIGRLRDITEKKLEEIKKKEEKNVDPLTGMYNFSSFKRLIEEFTERQKPSVHQIMVLHIANYKEIADCYGEVYRDVILMNVSDYIRHKIAGENVLTCRFSTNVMLLYVHDEGSIDGEQLRKELIEGLQEIYIGEKAINELQFQLGLYSGKEQINELLKVALEYINEDARLHEFDSAEMPETKVEVIAGEKRLFDVPEYKRSEYVTRLNENISSLILEAKDQQSTIRMILDRIGKFYQLDMIRIYEFPELKQSVMPAYIWAREDVKKECVLMPLSYQVQNLFAENFGHGRLVDNTIEAFRDFMGKFGENPLLPDGFSSLIFPLVSHKVCHAVLVFDVRKGDEKWDEDFKKYLLKTCKASGNYILMALDNDFVRQQRLFLTTMSKMLRMPMNSIFELTDIARKSVDNPEEIKRYIDLIDASSANMLHVVNNIIDLSRFNIEAVSLNETIFSLEDVLAEVENKTLKRAKEKQVFFLLVRKFKQNLLYGDGTRLGQVLSMLAENAVLYAKEQEIIRLIVSEEETEKTHVDLSFCLENPNIVLPEKLLPHLFNALADQNRNKGEREMGVGLDLGVCYQFVHLMGGKLEVESIEGKGTSFYFTLRLERANEDNLLGFFSQKKRTEEESVLLSGKNILVAEDDVINGEVLKRLFEINGANVDLVDNGQRCLEMFEKSEPGNYSFILMDISMPVMNGFDATREIRNLERKDAKEIPILALSANVFQEDILMSEKVGMDAYMAKPAHMDRILGELSKLKKIDI